jgi:hypothetical protein
MKLNITLAQLAIIYLVGFIFGSMVFLSISTPYPNMRDSWFHILVARAWYRGELGMVSPVVMDINMLPYPPLYHLMLAPFVATEASAITAQKVAQTLLYPLSLLGLMLLAGKYVDDNTAFIFGLLLTGTYFAFGMMQARPQSVEVLLFPVSLWALLEKKTKTFIGSTVAMFYLHSPFSIAMSLGMMLYTFVRDKKDIKFWAVIFLAAPMVLFQVSYFFDPDVVARWVTSGDLGIYTETMEFLANPALWLVNGLGLSLFALPALPYFMVKWKQSSELDKLMLYSFIGFFIVLPVWYMRVFHFAVIPLAYFMAKGVMLQERKVMYILIAIVLLQAAWFTLTPVFWMSKPPYLEQYW